MTSGEIHPSVVLQRSTQPAYNTLSRSLLLSPKDSNWSLAPPQSKFKMQTWNNNLCLYILSWCSLFWFPQDAYCTLSKKAYEPAHFYLFNASFFLWRNTLAWCRSTTWNGALSSLGGGIGGILAKDNWGKWTACAWHFTQVKSPLACFRISFFFLGGGCFFRPVWVYCFFWPGGCFCFFGGGVHNCVVARSKQRTQWLFMLSSILAFGGGVFLLGGNGVENLVQKGVRVASWFLFRWYDRAYASFNRDSTSDLGVVIVLWFTAISW